VDVVEASRRHVIACRRSAMKIVASIEARMGSTRLPGKVLIPVLGVPTLGHMIRRVKRSHFIDEIVVATTSNPADEPICKLSEQEGVHFYRGSEEDVLQRVVDAHVHMGTSVIVELTGDCPLIDPYWIDRTIEKYLEGSWEFVSNCIPMTFPRGTDCKVFDLESLIWTADNIDDPAVRENVSLYYYEEEGRFTIGTVEAPRWLRFPKYRWTLDTQEDLDFIKAVYEELYPANNSFGSRQIIDLLKKKSHLIGINSDIQQKPVRE
jgi:spore coat polysaccharide biosynthesis protein SpsF